MKCIKKNLHTQDKGPHVSSQSTGFAFGRTPWACGALPPWAYCAIPIFPDLRSRKTKFSCCMFAFATSQQCVYKFIFSHRLSVPKLIFF